MRSRINLGWVSLGIVRPWFPSGWSNPVISSAMTRVRLATYCPDPSLPRPVTLALTEAETFNPSPSTVVYPPLIHHLAVEMQFDGSLTDFISQKTQMERSYVLELLAFGCIYVGQYQDVRALSARKKPISKIQRTVQDIMPIQPCTYIRVHVNPHRFPSALRQDWSCRYVPI
mmetsp:Transcript_18206/g.37965  ORF Transcript_18206/g.37965 Transcript_18206/m.37965 type:complete len:172 (-) Transcript_18206:896-1411(-)